MVVGSSGAAPRKFTDEDVLRVFDEEQRRSVGKIELSAKEVADILNRQILPENTSVTRQAVDKRLKEMAGDKVVRSKHGRSYLYRHRGDMDRLFGSEIDGSTKTLGENDGDAIQHLSDRLDRLEQEVEELCAEVNSEGGGQ